MPARKTPSSMAQPEERKQQPQHQPPLTLAAQDSYAWLVDKRHIIDQCLHRYNRNPVMAKYVLSCLLPAVALSAQDLQARVDQLTEYEAILAHLLLRRGIEQRTPAWYAARDNMITASDFAQALGLGKFGTRKQLFWKKCIKSEASGPDAFSSLASLPPIKWGAMYEDVAKRLYQHRNNGINVHEFGLLQHPDVSYAGASPDGITEHGIMLEIKCPYRREITGEVPLQYYYQIQGQLAVCSGLRECDYLEVGLEELQRDQFYESCNERGYEDHGIVAEFVCAPPEDGPVENQQQYKYSDVDWFQVELNAFEHAMQAEAAARRGRVRFHYWRVKAYSCVRITRDDEFVATMMEGIREFWEKVLVYRASPELMEKEIGLPRPGKTGRASSDFAFRTDGVDGEALLQMLEGPIISAAPSAEVVVTTTLPAKSAAVDDSLSDFVFRMDGLDL